VAHCLLLQLERWSRDESSSKKQRQEQQQHQQEQQPPPYRYSLQLLVPPGQLELGRRLITSMYSSSPDLSDLDALQLMQLVTLAECYGVGKVVEDAAGQLHELTVQSMPLEIAAAVFELPEACLELEAVQQVQQAAADKLQQELGDLEVVWGDEGKRQALKELPYGALLRLLGDRRTRVASEDTVVYTALNWFRTKAASPGKQLQQQQLAAVFCLPHCTGTYLARLSKPPTTEERPRSWVYDDDIQLVIGLLAVSGRSSTQRSGWLQAAQADRPAWHLQPRPMSAVSQLQLSWDLPLADLEKVVAATPSAEVALTTYPCGVTMWQGRRWWFRFNYSPGKRQVIARLCLSHAPAFVTARITLESTVEGSQGVSFTLDGAYVQTNCGGALLEWGADKHEWPQVKAWLQQQGLVHSDGCLHLSATVADVA
jgi:hypothetical protein